MKKVPKFLKIILGVLIALILIIVIAFGGSDKEEAQNYTPESVAYSIANMDGSEDIGLVDYKATDSLVRFNFENEDVEIASALGGDTWSEWQASIDEMCSDFKATFEECGLDCDVACAFFDADGDLIYYSVNGAKAEL